MKSLLQQPVSGLREDRVRHCFQSQLLLLPRERQSPGERGLRLVQVSGWHCWAVANTLLVNYAALRATPWSPGLR